LAGESLSGNSRCDVAANNACLLRIELQNEIKVAIVVYIFQRPMYRPGRTRTERNTRRVHVLIKDPYEQNRDRPAPLRIAQQSNSEVFRYV